MAANVVAACCQWRLKCTDFSLTTKFNKMDKNLNKPQTPPLQQTAVSGWVAVTDALPKPLQTVWLTNGKGWCCSGCLVESDGGWHWAESNGVIYIENGEIVSECESEDLDVNYWHELPKPPCH